MQSALAWPPVVRLPRRLTAFGHRMQKRFAQACTNVDDLTPSLFARAGHGPNSDLLELNSKGGSKHKQANFGVPRHSCGATQCLAKAKMPLRLLGNGGHEVAIQSEGGTIVIDGGGSELLQFRKFFGAQE